MASSVNPSTWPSFNLSMKNKEFDSVMRVFLTQLSQFATQLQQQLGSATYLASVLNGSGSLSAGAYSQLSVANGTETANRTVNASGLSVLAIDINVTGAINYVLTINSLSTGTLVSLRLFNGSGAARTFTVSAPSSNVYLMGTGALVQLNSGTSIASNAAWNGIGVINGGALLLVGGVGS